MAATRPMMSATVEPPLLDCRLVRTFVRMSLAGPGATVARLSIRGWMADGPMTPSTETSASSIGNSERMPKYVSAAAHVVSLSSPNCLNVRFRIVGQESLGMSVGESGELPDRFPFEERSLLETGCDPA